MNQYKELKDSFLLLKAQINALCASNSSSNEENYHELRRATVDFEKICDNLPDAIYIADKEGTTVYVNDMYQQLSGILKEEVIGENIHQINREKKLYTNGILPTILKQERRSEKIGVMNRTNTTVYITGFPIFDDNHELKYAVAHDRNIQQLEIVKDQLLHLKEVQAKTENEVQYLRTQQIKQVDLIFKSPQMYQALSTALAVASATAQIWDRVSSFISS